MIISSQKTNFFVMRYCRHYYYFPFITHLT